MPIYITQGRYTRDAIKGMIVKPEDRADAISRAMTRVGGRLISYYVTFGEFDFMTVCEALQIHPDLGFNSFNPSHYACLSVGDSVYSSRDVGANRLCRIQAIDYFNEAPANPEPQPPADVPGRRARG